MDGTLHAGYFARCLPTFHLIFINIHLNLQIVCYNFCFKHEETGAYELKNFPIFQIPLPHPGQCGWISWRIVPYTKSWRFSSLGEENNYDAS